MPIIPIPLKPIPDSQNTQQLAGMGRLGEALQKINKEDLDKTHSLLDMLTKMATLQEKKDAHEQLLQQKTEAEVARSGAKETEIAPDQELTLRQAVQGQMGGLPLEAGMKTPPGAEAFVPRALTIPNAEIQSEVLPQIQPSVTEAELNAGLPEFKTLQKGGLTLPEIKKTQATGGGFGGQMLSDEELKIAVQKYEANPASIGLLRPNQKSQVLLASEKNVTPAQYAQTQIAQANYQKTDKTLALLEGAFNKTQPVAGQLETWKAAPKKFAEQLTRFNNDIIAYGGLVAGSIGNLSRSLFGEKGVLTDLDVERVKKALPDAIVTNSVLAKMQFDYLKNLNQSIKDGTLSVYDFGSKENFVTEMVNDLERIKQSAGETPKTENKPAADAILQKYGIRKGK